MLASTAELSDHAARRALVSRITARRALLEAMAEWASRKDLEELADDEEEDLKALARMPVGNLDDVREEATLLVDRELEERITFGELALIMSIISNLTDRSARI